MKGVSTWFWIVAGIIAGLIIFSVAYKQIVQLNLARIEQKSLEQYDEIRSIIDNLCWLFAGNKREYTLILGNTVEGIYVATNPYQEYDREDLINKVLAQEKANGNYLCIKIKGKKLKCGGLKCDASMPFMGSVPVEFSLDALVNKIMGRGEVFTYPLFFKREESVVRIDSIEPPVVCDWNEIGMLISCQNQGQNPVLVAQNKIVILGDITPWIDSSPELLTLLKNTAHYLGGSKVLIIWEDGIVDPTFPKYALEGDGFEVISFRHTSSIPNLDDYDQVWILNPGWCEHPIRKNTAYCIGTASWANSEIESIKEAVENGKGLFLITDYEQIEARTFNKILENIEMPFKQIKGCRCGCGTTQHYPTLIKEHPITQNINNFEVKAVARLECVT